MAATRKGPLTKYSAMTRDADAGDARARVLVLVSELESLGMWFEMYEPPHTPSEAAARFEMADAVRVVNQMWESFNRARHGPLFWLRRIDAAARDQRLIYFDDDEHGATKFRQCCRTLRAWRSSKRGARKSTMDRVDGQPAMRPLRGRFVEAAAFLKLVGHKSITAPKLETIWKNYIKATRVRRD